MNRLDALLKGYLAALYWTKDFDPEAPDTKPNPGLSESARRTCREDCRRFLVDSWPEVTEFLEDLSTTELEEAGHDLWLTRCFHGAGFWDGDWDFRGEGGEDWGDRLTEAAHELGPVEPYLGDDGLIYILGREGND